MGAPSMICANGHERPVHFNRGRLTHIWLCIACGKQLRGPKLREDEKQILVEFIGYQNAQTSTKGKNEMQLEIKVLAGNDSKQFLVDLTKQIDRLEKALTASAAITPEPTAGARPTETKSSKPAKTEKADKASTKRLAPIEEEETVEEEVTEEGSDDPADFDAEEESFEEAEEENVKTITKEEVLKTLSAFAKKHNRDKAMTILKKFAKTGAVKDVPADKYGALMNALK